MSALGKSMEIGQVHSDISLVVSLQTPEVETFWDINTIFAFNNS